MTSTVQLYRYDLTQGMARNMSMMLIGRQLEGIWHTSIVVYGHEFYFDGGVGVVSESHPGATRFGRPYRIETLGSTSKTEAEFVSWCARQRSSGSFGPNDYNLLQNNCNHFTQTASQYLLNRDIPSDVRNMIPDLLSTPLGRMLQPTLEQMSSAPPGTSTGFPVQPAASLVVSSSRAGEASCVGLLSTRTALTDAEEEDLLIAKAMLESNEHICDGGSEEGFRASLVALGQLRLILQNVLDHPAGSKYRGLSTSSTTYTVKLKPLEEFGALEILRTAGFKLQPHPSGTGQQWYLSDADASAAVITQVLSALDDVIADVETAQAVALSAAEDAANGTRPAGPSSSLGNGGRKLGGNGGDKDSESEVLRFCAAPFPVDYTPLRVGCEGGSPLFSILCTAGSGDAKNCFGKCRLSRDHSHVQAYYCSRSGLEKSITANYSVLCVRKGDEAELIWVPAAMIAQLCASSSSTSSGAAATMSLGDCEFVFRGYGRFAVARATVGAGTHPGVAEPAGRCVVPYGGKARDVTDDAQVLCLRSRLPASIMTKVDSMTDGEALLEMSMQAWGRPFASFDALLQWQTSLSPREKPAAPTLWSSAVAVSSSVMPLRPVTRKQEGGAKLLVCHDMRGGYPPADYPRFSLLSGTNSGSGGVVNEAYTPTYWHLVDSFVYFSHHRITVPPREWIDAGHRRGVPVLGTVITEGQEGRMDLQIILTDAKRMGAVITALVSLCKKHGFDGYLINIENSIEEVLSKRLILFVSMLRTKLKALGSHMSVIWYDAVASDGRLAYQNALTPKNKAFFDVSDGIFTNYFWNPMHIGLSRAAAAGRQPDVYVGVDVFGRSMHGGGKYNSWVAVREAVGSAGGSGTDRNGRSLSVALFAPGWTLESESQGTRAGFLRAESRLWSGLQGSFKRHSLVVNAHSDLPMATCYASGVGLAPFYINGLRVSGQEEDTSSPSTTKRVYAEWCQLSSAHDTPPFRFIDSTNAKAAVAFNSSSLIHQQHSPPFGLSLLQHNGGGMMGSSVTAEWTVSSCGSSAWYGDRALSVAVPAGAAVLVCDWLITGLSSTAVTASATADGTANDIVVDVAFSGAGAKPGRALQFLWKKQQSGEAAAVTPGSPASAVTAGSSASFPSAVRDDMHVEQIADASATVMYAGNGWCVMRYNISARVRESLAATAAASANEGVTFSVTSFAVANASEGGNSSLNCVMGGLCVCAVAAAGGSVAPSVVAESPLVARNSEKWLRYTFHPTLRSDQFVLELHDAQSILSSSDMPVDVALVATVLGGADDGGEATRVYMGQHTIRRGECDTLVVVAFLPFGSQVSKVRYYRVCGGY